MKLEIKDFSSGDIEEVWNCQKTSNESVYFHLEIEVGECGVSGGNVFQLIVATPEGVRAHHVGEASKSFLSLKATNKSFGKNTLLIIKDYRWEKLLERLNQIVKSCERDTWEQTIYELRKNFFWEYEGLQQH